MARTELIVFDRFSLMRVKYLSVKIILTHIKTNASQLQFVKLRAVKA